MSKEQNKRASEETLAELHSLIARSLIEKIQSGDANAGDLSVAVKFLKDNGINCIGTQNSEMKELVDALPSFPIGNEYDPMRSSQDIVFKQ